MHLRTRVIPHFPFRASSTVRQNLANCRRSLRELLHLLIVSELTDFRQLRSAPWAERNFDHTRPAIMDHKAKAASDLGDESIGAVYPIRMLRT